MEKEKTDMTSIPGINRMIRYYLGIGIIAGATLLMEVTMTRVFAVAFFNRFAFLIISTALFGFGFSGVFLSICPLVKKDRFDRLLTFFSLCYATSLVITLKIVVTVPLQFKNLTDDPVNLLFLLIYYVALSVPFFFSGLVVALLLTHIPDRVHKLYFADLLGASMGCLMVFVLVPLFGAPGTIVFSAMSGIFAAACFNFRNRKTTFYGGGIS